ncbi:uroporphyrin-III C-methyltransferase [Terracoccus luteus]|uniref:uroporphyrinogen-III C-methyltransferase n=1 Tax=Terracoccus luteus TaxID=53356 RepID=A0A495XVX0_9MICO|nr:uroporphyrinogen-III C-methyltransferase [Terracoccus luteus]RKT78417.1 uroporphyrin-III C-methyltransferase [Terracoccus luteus]
MLLQTDVGGVPVLVVGASGEVDASVRRWSRAGAVVTTAVYGTDPADPAADDLATLTTLTTRAETAHVAVLVGSADRPAVREVLEGRCLVVTEPAPVSRRGRVVLVGAGPGGPGLLTLDAVDALADADVVLADRLAEVGDLTRLAPGARIVDVGKRPGHHAVPQERIESLMVAAALEGLTVVRLKGGDPYVFGRGGEEVAAAVEAGVPVTVVPGVTSAVGVPGAAGIPVTHRGVSHVVTVVSGHVPLTNEQAGGLVALGGTIVLLMGVHNLVPLTGALVAAGLPATTPAAVVERGLTPAQRSVVGTVATLPDLARRHGVTSPAVIVVGEVVRRSQVWDRRVDGAVVADAEDGGRAGDADALADLTSWLEVVA